MIVSRRGALPTIAGSLVAGGAAAQPFVPVSLKLVVLDIGGTLIGDHGGVPEAMLGAFSRHGLTVTPVEFSEWRGASKRAMVQHFVGLRAPQGGAGLVEAIYADFTATATRAYQQVQPIAGAEDMLKALRAQGLLLATTTGFDRPLATAILARLGWMPYFVAAVTSDDVADGRPAPFMLFHAMEAARVGDVRQVMAVGDTPLDLQAGNNAGLGAVIGVWSGAASESRLRQERSTALLPSVAALPAWINSSLPAQRHQGE